MDSGRRGPDPGRLPQGLALDGRIPTTEGQRQDLDPLGGPQSRHRPAARESDPPQDAGEGRGIRTQVWHEARLGRVRQALDALPHFQQQVLELAHFSDLTHKEIAERLRLPPGTVKGRLRLGLQKLRKDTELRDVAAG
jgi:RNA polymerase sigma factor (sigma-70 family)